MNNIDDLKHRLELIHNGFLIEADEETTKEKDNKNNYGLDSIDDNTDSANTDDNQPIDTKESDNIEDGQTDDTTDYSLDSSENINDEQTDDTQQSDGDTSDTQSDGEQQPENVSKPGEILQLDSSSRKLLAYKNFMMYRSLRDDVQATLTELTEKPVFNNVNIFIRDQAIELLTKLVSKLNDYILYKYKKNTYEVNFSNYAQFIIEKRLILDLINTISDNTTNK